MPRIPVYNVTAQISGQAGSTSVPQISQAATSGAIASQTDSLSKGLQAISNVAANVVKLESERIIAKENIKYKTMLDTTEKLIQANFADQPELWMDYYENGFTVGEQYVPGRANIVSEIQNNKYKYDFINNSVLNQTEINNLAIREDLFEGYLKETKKQNLIAFEDTSKILGGDLGNSVNGDTPEFDTKLFLLEQELNKYASGGGNNPVGFQQEVFELALSNALFTEYGNRDAEDNINLLPSEVTNSNILEIMKRMDDDVVRATFDKFSDEADETIKDFNAIRSKKIDEGKFKINELMILYDNPNTSNTQKNEVAKIILSTDSIFFEEGEKLAFEQYHNQVVESGYQLNFNMTGDEALATRLTNLYMQNLIGFEEIRKNFPLLNIEQQKNLMSLKDAKSKENYNLANKVVKQVLGFSDLVQPNSLNTEKFSEQFINQSTQMVIKEFNRKILETGKDQDYPALIDSIANEVLSNQSSRLKIALQESINTFPYFPGEHLSIAQENINPDNILEVLEQTKKNIQNNTDLSKTEKSKLFYNLDLFDFEFGDLLRMYTSLKNE